MIKTKENKGITLVALVITIIVLLILAMVSIKIVVDSGIISGAKTAADKYGTEQEKENVNLAITQAKLANNGGAVTLKNLKEALEERFKKVEFISEENPFKVKLNDNDDSVYLIFENGDSRKDVEVTDEEIIEKFPLTGTLDEGSKWYTFDNDNFTKAYDYILSKNGKTVTTTDLLTSMKAIKKLTTAYSKQQGLDSEGLSNVLKLNYYVNVDGKLSYYASSYGGLDNLENRLTDEQQKELSELIKDKDDDEKSIITMKYIMSEYPAYLRAMQMSYASTYLEMSKVEGKYLIYNDRMIYEDKDGYDILKTEIDLLYPGGLFTGKSVRYYESNNKDFDYYSKIVDLLKLKRINDENNNILIVGGIIRLNDNKGVTLTDENIEEVKKQVNGKIVYYLSGDGEYEDKATIAFVATNLYIVNTEDWTACYIDSNGNISEGGINID